MLRDLATRRKEKNRTRLDISTEQGAAFDARRSRSHTEKPIVIGISIPKDQAEAHNGNLGDESAISLQTPTTPAIVVTPAHQTPWNSCSPTHDGRRPVSSWYSVVTPGADESPEQYIPPVPAVPSGLAIQPHLSPRLKTGLARQRSLDSLASTERDHSSPNTERRYSTESTQRIIPIADP